MDKNDLRLKYLDLMVENERHCVKEFSRAVKFFAVFALLFYLVYAFDIQELNLFGVTAQVPQSFILGAAPVILVYFFHNRACFSQLGGMYQDEIKNVIKELDVEVEAGFKDWQIDILYRASYDSPIFLREYISGSSRFLGVGGFVIIALLLIVYSIIPPLIIGFFVWVGYSVVNSQWIYLPYAIVTFLTLYSFFQMFEELPLRKKSEVDKNIS